MVDNTVPGSVVTPQPGCAHPHPLCVTSLLDLAAAALGGAPALQSCPSQLELSPAHPYRALLTPPDHLLPSALLEMDSKKVLLHDFVGMRSG